MLYHLIDTVFGPRSIQNNNMFVISGTLDLVLKCNIYWLLTACQQVVDIGPLASNTVSLTFQSTIC